MFAVRIRSRDMQITSTEDIETTGAGSALGGFGLPDRLMRTAFTPKVEHQTR